MATFLADREEFPLDAVLARVLVHDLLQRAVLTDRERTVLYLRYWQDLTQREIAERLGISRQRVGEIETRAIARLREKIIA